MSKFRVSVIIRTLNEGQFLDQVLTAIEDQDADNFEVEVVVVDSGSTDDTTEIARRHNATIIPIKTQDFTFGGALNIGCANSGDVDAIISLSGHCIPVTRSWLSSLLRPIYNGSAQLSFGKQTAPSFVRTSERNYFCNKYRHMEEGYVGGENFNNGNSAVSFHLWRRLKYNESLSAQEDIEFAVRAEREGSRVYYVPDAEVTHVHDDTNIKVYKRLVREIQTEIFLDVKARHAVFMDIVKTPVFILHDARVAYQNSKLSRAFKGILGYRVMQMMACIVAFYRSYRYSG